MKKTLTALSFFLAFAVAIPLHTMAEDPKNKTERTSPNEEARAAELVQRLEEIKSMDRSELTRTEKKELRKEVKEIKKEMKAMKGGVYLSVSAIIIIILLLILLL